MATAAHNSNGHLMTTTTTYCIHFYPDAFTSFILYLDILLHFFSANSASFTLFFSSHFPLSPTIHPAAHLVLLLRRLCRSKSPQSFCTLLHQICISFCARCFLFHFFLLLLLLSFFIWMSFRMALIAFQSIKARRIKNMKAGTRWKLYKSKIDCKVDFARNTHTQTEMNREKRTNVCIENVVSTIMWIARKNPVHSLSYRYFHRFGATNSVWLAGVHIGRWRWRVCVCVCVSLGAGV